jgi:hypothetical protein
MAFNLLDAVSRTIGTQLSSQASRLFGKSASGTQSAVGRIVPAILDGVMKQGSTADFPIDNGKRGAIRAFFIATNSTCCCDLFCGRHGSRRRNDALRIT